MSTFEIKMPSRLQRRLIILFMLSFPFMSLLPILRGFDWATYNLIFSSIVAGSVGMLIFSLILRLLGFSKFFAVKGHLPPSLNRQCRMFLMFLGLPVVLFLGLNPVLWHFYGNPFTSYFTSVIWVIALVGYEPASLVNLLRWRETAH